MPRGDSDDKAPCRHAVSLPSGIGCADLALRLRHGLPARAFRREVSHVARGGAVQIRLFAPQGRVDLGGERRGTDVHVRQCDLLGEGCADGVMPGRPRHPFQGTEDVVQAENLPPPTVRPHGERGEMGEAGATRPITSSASPNRSTQSAASIPQATCTAMSGGRSESACLSLVSRVNRRSLPVRSVSSRATWKSSADHNP